MTTTPLLEALCSIDETYWDDLANDLERTAALARPIDTDIFAALDLARAEWCRVFDFELPRKYYDHGIWVYPLGSEQRIVRAASEVKRYLDEIIADLVRKEVA